MNNSTISTSALETPLDNLLACTNQSHHSMASKGLRMGSGEKITEPTISNIPLPGRDTEPNMENLVGTRDGHPAIRGNTSCVRESSLQPTVNKGMYLGKIRDQGPSVTALHMEHGISNQQPCGNNVEQNRKKSIR